MEAPEGTGHLTTEELFRQHAGFVARFLTRLGVPTEQRQDALQEVFLVAHRNGGYRPGTAKPTSYLANIAIRAAAQQRRRQGVARQRHSEAPVEQLPGDDDNPARALQTQQDLQRLQRALERLPEDLRTTLVLVELEGESCVSVAAGLGCPVGTIYWRLHLARKELQSALKAADAPRRSARPVAVPGGRAQPARTFMLLFGLDGFRRSEASRLLQLAREQPPPSLALDELLGRHQRLVQSGELPSWAHGFTPHASSWLTLVGAGPLAVGAVAGAAIVAAVALTTYGAPPAQPERPPPTAAIAVVEPARAPSATTASDKPTPETQRTQAASALVQNAEPTASAAQRASEPASAKRVRARRDRIVHARVPDAPALETTASSTSTARDVSDARADKAIPTSPAQAAGDRRDDAVDKPAAEPAAPAPVVPSKSSTAPDLELAEMREIERAERLLADDPQRALESTRAMHFPEGHFREERAYLEVMALRGLGRTREMRDKAAAFLHAYPTGLYSSRVRKAAAGEVH
jgi:RNA polymerase sigma-70 factor (ECF subfamily)